MSLLENLSCPSCKAPFGAKCDELVEYLKSLDPNDKAVAICVKCQELFWMDSKKSHVLTAKELLELPQEQAHSIAMNFLVYKAQAILRGAKGKSDQSFPG